MSEPPRIDPALEFGGQQPERSDQDFKQRFQGLQDSFYAHNAFYGPYPPPAQTASQTPADSADAALQAIATAAQDRRPSTPSSASVGAADPNAQSAQTKLGPDGKRLRACDHCRALKVRCDPQEENGLISEASPCKRCLKSKKVCVTTAPTKKRTKKADTRVAELEKKVNELTARLGDDAVASYAYASHPPLPDGAHGVDFADSTRPEKRRRTNDQHDALMSNEARREIMYDEHAEIAAAAHQRVENRLPQSDYSYISYEVDRCISPDVAERISLLVCVLWYRPPVVYERHAFYMMTNAAITMVLELGLGKRAGKAKAKLGLGPFRRCLPNAGGIDARRSFMVCYYLGTNIAMVLRRPMLLRWNQYMDECISELESSPDALPSDKVLCYHIKLAAIAEDVASQFSMDDPATSANFSEKYNEIALRNYDTKLELLRPQRPSNANQTVLKFSESVVGLYTHEVAMHHNQNMDDALEEGRQKALGAVQTSSLKECVKSCHGILDSFLSLDFDAFYALPLMFSVRCVYSTVCLTKLWADATFPGDLGSVITPDSLRLEHYFDNLIQRFQTTEERDPQSPHTKFPRILLRLREKFNRMKNGETCADVFSGQPPASASGPSAPAATTSTANGAHEQTRHTFPANGNNVATTQTPLHLLSEVAQQAQAPPLQQGYYDNGMGGQALNHYNWDMAAFGDFDFSSMGMGVDLASLFGGDMGGYEPQSTPTQYGPHQGAAAPMYPEPSTWNT
ncbi:C6 transcription factor [Lasiodiplodia theobromae]|uniref:C6 transcription factor n=1 Tax=Lasiodiplodia theobromae TaxID=45133 RepID=UPI0015C2FBBD|nr:C6 transcription factor [Lasiodiplodia theobromae]KAF4537935.1 C6 transcription factor [Lasiodiplodia theobromae]